MRVLLVVLALGLSGPAQVAAAAPACPRPLRIAFNDSATPPMLNGQGSAFAEPPGWEVEVVRDALKRMGCEAELTRLPSRRLSALLAQGQVDFALFFGPTRERLKALRFPLDAQGRPDLAWAPAFGHLALYGRPGTAVDAGWDGHRLPPGVRVGVLAGSVQHTLAQERGWPVEPIRASEAAVAMLQAERFDLLLSNRETLTAEQRASLVEWSPVVVRLPYYAPASPRFAKAQPAWTRAFWLELCHSARRIEPEVRPVDCGIPPPSAGH
jgi:ABC-type amino acid transport substrate-binding protein